MFVTKRRLIRVLGINLAVHQQGYNNWSTNKDDMGFEMCNIYSNRMQAIMEVAKDFRIEKQVVAECDRYINATSGAKDD